jgi:hypothetical protein
MPFDNLEISLVRPVMRQGKQKGLLLQFRPIGANRKFAGFSFPEERTNRKIAKIINREFGNWQLNAPDRRNVSEAFLAGVGYSALNIGCFLDPMALDEIFRIHVR